MATIIRRRSLHKKGFHDSCHVVPRQLIVQARIQTVRGSSARVSLCKQSLCLVGLLRGGVAFAALLCRNKTVVQLISACSRSAHVLQGLLVAPPSAFTGIIILTAAHIVRLLTETTHMKLCFTRSSPVLTMWSGLLWGPATD